MNNEKKVKWWTFTKLRENLLEFFKDPPIVTIIIVWLLFLASFWFFIFKYSEKFALNNLWDAMWGIFWTLISTLALIFVAYSYLIQRETLKVQKAELEATRKEFIEQTNTLKKDNFENTFFKLTEKQSNLIEYFQWWDTKWYDALYGQENTFEYDIEFFWRKNSPPLQEYIKNYIKINEVIINLIESTFNSYEDKFMYYDILNSLQSNIIKKMIKWYYIYTWETRYLQLIDSNS